VIEHEFAQQVFGRLRGGRAVSKRYREVLEEIECEEGRPVAFAWRGRRYRVTGVLGHWREDAGWWARPNGGAPVRIEQADLWRVEAGRAGAGGSGRGGLRAGAP
jgi:hypothetical protein